MEWAEKITPRVGYAAPIGSVVVIEADRCNCCFRFSDGTSGVVVQGSTRVFDHECGGGWYEFATPGRWMLLTSTEATAFRRDQRRAEAA